MAKPVHIFYCYSHEDEPLRKRLQKHLSPLKPHIEEWSDQNILPGTAWEQEIDKRINDANLILLLISPDFLASESCKQEMEKARERHEKGEAHVVPIILRPVMWQLNPSISKLQVQPKDGRPITQWPNEDEGFLNVADGIAKILLEEGAFSPQEASILKQRNLPAVVDTSGIASPGTTSRKDRESTTFLNRVRIRLTEDRQKSLKGKGTIQLTLHDSSGVPLNLPLIQHLDNIDYELLILGELGSGKTLRLLDLALELCEQAERDETKPMPVVLNLSSWAKRRKPIAEWLIEELSKKPFRITRKTCQTWIHSHQILLMLDGLDEIPSEYRDACIDAINVYRKQNSIVVCRRSADDQAQRAQLKLPGTVIVQPLTMPQIDDYIINAGRSLLSVRQVLDDDTALKEKLTTPLVLSVIIEACQEIEARQKIDDTDLRALPSPERQQKLLENYVQHMLEAHEQDAYPSEETKERLSWLAWQLTQRNLKVFFTKQIQRDWLAAPQSRWSSFDRGVKWFIGLDCGLFSGLLSGQFFRWLLWLLPMPYKDNALVFGWVGIFLGLALGIPFSLSIDFLDAESHPPLGSRLFKGLLGSLLFGYLWGWGSGFFNPPTSPDIGGLWSIFGILNFIPICFCLIFFILPSMRIVRYDIRPLAIPKKGIWQPTLFLVLLLSGIALVVLGIIIGVSHPQLSLIGIVSWLIGGLLCGIFVAVPLAFGYFFIRGWFSCTIRKDEIESVTTRRDLWHFVNQCILFGLTGGFVGGLSAWLIVTNGPALLHNSFGIPIDNLQSLQTQLMQWIGVNSDGSSVSSWSGKGLLFGVLLSMLFGGPVCMKHITLQWRMWSFYNKDSKNTDSKHWEYLRYAYIPQDGYTAFLDHAVHLSLLRKVEEGYCFIDPLLQQFFSENFRTIANVSPVPISPPSQRPFILFAPLLLSPMLSSFFALGRNILKNNPRILTFLRNTFGLHAFPRYFYVLALVILLKNTLETSLLLHNIPPEQFTASVTLSLNSPHNDGLTLVSSDVGPSYYELPNVPYGYTLLFTNDTSPCKQITLSLPNQDIMDSKGNLFDIPNLPSYTFSCNGFLFIGRLYVALSSYKLGGSIEPIQGLTVTEVPTFTPNDSNSMNTIYSNTYNIGYGEITNEMQSNTYYRGDNTEYYKGDSILWWTTAPPIGYSTAYVPPEETLCAVSKPLLTEKTITITSEICAVFVGDPLAALITEAKKAGRGDNCTLLHVQLDQTFVLQDTLMPTYTDLQTLDPPGDVYPPRFAGSVAVYPTNPYLPISDVSVVYNLSGNCWY